MNGRWYVLRIKPHKDRKVYKFLQAKDVDVYFPTFRANPKNPRAARIRPFFPGYMFVNIDLEQEGSNALRWVPGTRGLVRFGGKPAVVPHNLIHELKERVSNFEQQQGEDEGFQEGDRVRITSGPLAGYEAIFDTRLSGKDRVQVLLSLLNRQPRRVALSAEHLEKAD